MPIRVHNVNVDKDGEEVSSFHKDDRAILNSPKALEKIKRVWRSSVVDVDLYTLDVKLDTNVALSIAIDGAYFNDDHAHAHHLTGMDGIEFNPESINVIFSNNQGAERYPLTGWIIAHRLFHAFQSERWGKYHQADTARVKGETTPHQIVNAIFTQLSGILFDLENYEVTNGHYQDHLPKRDLAALMGTTKACREFRLSNSSEILPECFAQYMLKGKVTLRPLPSGKFRNGNETGFKFYEPTPDTDIRFCNHVVKSFEDYLNLNFRKLIEAAKGRVVAL